MDRKQAFQNVIRQQREKAEGRCTLINCAQMRMMIGHTHWKCSECGRFRSARSYRVNRVDDE